MITTNNPNEARKEIEKLAKEGKEVIVRGDSIDFNRLILENRKVNVLVLSHNEGKDRLKQRDSGLNEVLCGIAKKNNISFAFDMKELNIEDKKQKGKILGRMMQNIFLMKKSKNKLKLINFDTKEGGFAFLISLGADTFLAKKAIQN